MREMMLLMLALTVGCSGLLPHGEDKTVSQWDSYQAAKSAYDEVVPFATTEDDLDALGFTPGRQPNIRILNHTDIAERFMPVALGRDDLPIGLRQCLDRYGDCYGYEIRRHFTEDQRYGNFLADFLRFKRKTETRGWAFEAVIVLIDHEVVYKVWGGTPEIHEYRDEINPLGPLQGIGPSLTPRPD